MDKVMEQSTFSIASHAVMLYIYIYAVAMVTSPESLIERSFYGIQIY